MVLFRIYCRVFQKCFKFFSPLLPWREPQLLEGPGSLLRVPELLNERKLKRLLLVTDKGISSLGLIKPLLKELEKNAISCTVYDETVPNPTITNIEAALTLYIQNNCQALLAFGGGSPMDCAKGVGARLARPDKQVQQLRGVLRVRKKIPPLIAIPTTAGTGSEATLAAVVSNPETHEKYTIIDHALIPHFAVLDPELTLGLPAAITAATGMDALTHAVEAYIGGSNTAGTEAAAIAAVRFVIQNLLKVYRNPSDLEGRAILLKAAYLGGKAFTRAYVGNIHAMAHTLGGFYGTPHGLANAVIMPYVLDYYSHAVERRLARLAEAAGLYPQLQGSHVIAQRFIEDIKQLNKDLQIPLHIQEIQDTDIPLMAERAFSEANPLYPVPVILSKQQFEDLYRIIRGL